MRIAISALRAGTSAITRTKKIMELVCVLHVARKWTHGGKTMADETGTVLPWEKDAMAGLEMPEGLSYPDQILYLELRMLYHQYYQKVIDRETATREKKKLLDEYRCYQYREEMGNHWVEIIRLTDLSRCDYKKNRTLENADRLIEIIEGKKL